LTLRKLVVVGTGLIGGSFALALRRRQAVTEVVGVGRTRPNLDAAREAGIVDRVHTLDDSWTDELRDADVVMMAAPVAQFPSLFAAMAGSLGATTAVTDAGSTKQDVIATAREHLGAAFSRFVPGHPIAGNEHSGASAATATLFEGRNVVLTPLAETDGTALSKVRALWTACGASVVEMDARAHDRVLAAVSHLPHLLSSAYVADLAVRGNARDLFALAGTGFRDFTRIAASSPEMWRDISLANRAALLEEIAAYRGALDVVESSLAQGDGTALEELFQSASVARRSWNGPADEEG
jgi:prephenate dehydrogenase